MAYMIDTIFNKRVFDDKAKVQEMLVLRYVHYWTLNRLGEKYGVSKEAIRLQLLKYDCPSLTRGDNGGQKFTTMSSILEARGESMVFEEAPEPFRAIIRAPRKPRYPTDTKELRDEFGERINRGRSYKDYLKEQYPHLTAAKLNARTREKKL